MITVIARGEEVAGLVRAKTPDDGDSAPLNALMRDGDAVCLRKLIPFGEPGSETIIAQGKIVNHDPNAEWICFAVEGESKEQPLELPEEAFRATFRSGEQIILCQSQEMWLSGTSENQVTRVFKSDAGMELMFPNFTFSVQDDEPKSA